jgi:hypothetical protein
VAAGTANGAAIDSSIAASTGLQVGVTQISRDDGIFQCADPECGLRLAFMSVKYVKKASTPFFSPRGCFSRSALAGVRLSLVVWVLG